MKKNDLLSIFVTFVVGFIFGGYFYLTNFAGFATKIATPEEKDLSEFVIEAEVYGGCRNTCPSFQVQNDGSYHYLYTPAVGAEKVVRKGELPNELMDRLHLLVVAEGLSQQAKVIEPAVCNSYTDGIDVKYEITLDDTVYILNSCGTAVSSESQMWVALGDIWDHFESGQK